MLYIDINYIILALQLPESQTNSYCQSSVLKASHSTENSLIWQLYLHFCTWYNNVPSIFLKLR